MNRCRRCGLTDKYAFAAMDENGVCKYCRGFRKRVFKGPESLIKDLDLGPSEKVGVTVSGGKDSIFIVRSVNYTWHLTNANPPLMEKKRSTFHTS